MNRSSGIGKTLALTLMAAVAVAAYADTVKGTATTDGSWRYGFYTVHGAGPVSVTALLKRQRPTTMAVFDAGFDEIVCMSVGGFSASTDRQLRCQFDAYGTSDYYVVLSTDSGSNNFDLTIRVGTNSSPIQINREPAPEAGLARMRRAMDRSSSARVSDRRW